MSTAYWQTRMRTSSTGLLRHRPSEARLATCALQGRYRTDSDDPALLALSSPKKFLRMFLCRPGTLAPFVPYAFHRSIRGSRAVIAQSDIRCATQSQPRVQSRLHSHPRSCRLGGVLRGDAMPGQACSGGQERMSACASNIPVDRRNNATALSMKARKSSRTKSGHRGLASRLDSTRRRTLWVSCL